MQREPQLGAVQPQWERAKRHREEQEKEEKNNGLVFLEFFTFSLENLVTVIPNICFTKVWFWFKFTHFQLSTP
jgi:hypothetical protein